MSAADGLRKLPGASQWMASQPQMEGASRCAVWEGGGYRAMVSREPYGKTVHGNKDMRWHVSVSRQDGEVPTWDDMASIVHRLRPGVPMVIGIPPRDQWMSVPGVEVLHAIQVRDENLTERWKEEATGRRQ